MESSRAFYQLYWMEIESFNKRCSWISPLNNVDLVMSSVCTGKTPVIPEVALHCLLRWLAGVSHSDIRISAGISASSFYVCIYKCINARLLCNQLSICFPTSDEEILESAQKFQRKAQVASLSVACLDGMLLPIQSPSSDETGNVTAYYSGHYAEFGINIQAGCDSFCRFVYGSVSSPGGTSDVVALRRTSLCQRIEKLPLEMYVLADNAYVCLSICLHLSVVSNNAGHRMIPITTISLSCETGLK